MVNLSLNTGRVCEKNANEETGKNNRTAPQIS